MKQCSNCRCEISTEDLYCGQCGMLLQSSELKPAITKAEIRIEEVRFNLGMVYFKMGKYCKAIEMFEKTIAINPKNLASMEMLNRANEALSMKVKD